MARRDGPAAGALARARCLGKATVAVGAGREDATASRPKMPERGKRWDGMGWDAFVPPGAAFLPLALHAGYSSASAA